MRIVWSNLPYNEWIKIVLIKPMQTFKDKYVKTPQAQGIYISYQCKFAALDDGKHTFDIVFPYYVFDSALRALPLRVRKDIGLEDDVEMEILKESYKLMRIRNLRVIK